MTDNISEPHKKKLKKNPTIISYSINTFELNENSIEGKIDLSLKKKHKKKKKHCDDKKVCNAVMDNDCVLEDKKTSPIENTLVENNGNNFIPKNKNKKRKERLVETTVKETNASIDSGCDLNLIETCTSPIKKKKKKEKIKEELVVSEKDIKIKSEPFINNPEIKHNIDDKDLILNDTNTSPFKKKKKKEKKEKKIDLCEKDIKIKSEQFINNQEIEHNNNDMNNTSEIIQRPSYGENKETPFSEYQDSQREMKRSFYPDLKEDVMLCKVGRQYTISIALPASILEETCLAQVLRTYVIGQLARAVCIYSIDEIIVFNDNCWGGNSANCNKYLGMMKMILEYQECPQYLRKNLFPIHKFLMDAGVMNALNAPHHLLAYQWCDYREGVVLSKSNGKFSFADIGLKSDVQIDRKLEPGLRITVRMPPETKTMKKMYGYVVSPEEPRTKAGMYWGYTVRVANSLSEVFKSDRFSNGYDLIIGTSDKGTKCEDVTFKQFSHALVVFGGVQGLEAAQSADESLSKSDMSNIFDHYVNVCPNQTSRTIRTEEAVLITLATLCPKLTVKGNAKVK